MLATWADCRSVSPATARAAGGRAARLDAAQRVRELERDAAVADERHAPRGRQPRG